MSDQMMKKIMYTWVGLVIVTTYAFTILPALFSRNILLLSTPPIFTILLLSSPAIIIGIVLENRKNKLFIQHRELSRRAAVAFIVGVKNQTVARELMQYNKNIESWVIAAGYYLGMPYNDKEARYETFTNLLAIARGFCQWSQLETCAMNILISQKKPPQNKEYENFTEVDEETIEAFIICAKCPEVSQDLFWHYYDGGLTLYAAACSMGKEYTKVKNGVNNSIEGLFNVAMVECKKPKLKSYANDLTNAINTRKSSKYTCRNS